MVALVVGATGMLGAAICACLKAQDLPVRGLVRPGSSRAGLLVRMGVEIVHGDLTDADSLHSACRGVGVVISSATSIVSHRAGDTLKRVDRDGQLELLRVARQQGVRRYFFVSASAHPSIHCPFLDYKRWVEVAVETSGLNWTILRPALFMETAFSPAFGWDLAKRRAHVFGSGTNPISYISRDDVATFAVSLLAHRGAENRAVALGGPEALTQLEAVRVVGEVVGQPFAIKRTPGWALQLLRTALRPLHPKLSSLLALGLATAGGCAIPMEQTRCEFPIALLSVREYARKCVAEIATPKPGVA